MNEKYEEKFIYIFKGFWNKKLEILKDLMAFIGVIVTLKKITQ